MRRTTGGLLPFECLETLSTELPPRLLYDHRQGYRNAASGHLRHGSAPAKLSSELA